MKYYIEMWKRAFDYKGMSDKKSFWVPFAINAVVGAVLALLLILSWLGVWFVGFLALLLAIYLCICAVPFAALTVRRLHDVGKSGWWYFLVFGAGVGAVALAVILAGNSGAFSPEANLPTCVYGPPEYFGEFDPSSNTNVAMYGPPENEIIFNPDDNMNVDVYGPPPEDIQYDPDENLEPTVYGPPEMFE